MNNVSLIGRLTKDVELRYTQSQKPVTSFTLAVDNPFNKDDTNFINIVVWNKTAEFAANHLTKGTRIGITGAISTRSWEDNDGNRHYTTEVVAQNIYFADAPKDHDLSPTQQPEPTPTQTKKYGSRR